VLMLCLPADILVVFRRLEKTFLKDDLLITEVVSAREAAVGKLEIMLDAPFPSGKEMHHLTEMNSDLADVLDQRKMEIRRTDAVLTSMFRRETGATEQ